MDSLYERTEQEMVENAPIPLFKVGEKRYKTRLRCAATVDEWLHEAERVADLAMDVDFVTKQVGLLYNQWLILKAQHDTGGEMPGQHVLGELLEALPSMQEPDGTGATREPVASADDVDAAYARLCDMRVVARRKTREYLDGLFECVCSYCPDDIPRDALRKHGVSDEQIVTAFIRLRYFSDPLAAQQRVTVGMLKARPELMAKLSTPTSKPSKV